MDKVVAVVMRFGGEFHRLPVDYVEEGWSDTIYITPAGEAIPDMELCIAVEDLPECSEKDALCGLGGGHLSISPYQAESIIVEGAE